MTDDKYRCVAVDINVKSRAYCARYYLKICYGCSKIAYFYHRIAFTISLNLHFKF